MALINKDELLERIFLLSPRLRLRSPASETELAEWRTLRQALKTIYDDESAQKVKEAK